MSSRVAAFSDGVASMVYEETRGSGPFTFVLVHGIGMGRVVFAGVAERLGLHGRVLAVDLPGFGESPEPEVAATIEGTADFIARFVAGNATGPIVLVGHSMGTQVVAEVAARHPELVASLVLIAPTVNRAERTAVQQALRMLQDLAGEGPKVLLTGAREYLRTSPRWFRDKLRLMLGHPLETVCPEIPAPTLVLRGANDRVCPRDWVREIAELIPNGRMTEIPGRGHETMISDPEPVASLILGVATAAATE